MKSLITTIVASLMLGGGVVADTINVPGDYSTIQGAIDASDGYDTILVSPGTYSAGINISNMPNITIASTDGPLVTFIDGGGVGYGIRMLDGAEEVTLSGLTIQNCYSETNYGAGLDQRNSYQDLMIFNCQFKNNIGNTGGAIHLENSEYLIENCVFEDNAAGYGGGAIWTDGGGDGINGVIRSSIFRRNSGGSGGAISRAAGEVSIEDCVFESNTASNSGGAVYSGVSNPPVQVSTSSFCNNQPDNFSGNVDPQDDNTYEEGCPSVITVSQDGQGDFTSIQPAVDAANDGDTILVGEGIYISSEPSSTVVSFNDKNLVLRSVSGPEVTIIDSQSSGRGIAVNSGQGPNTIIEGFTIRNAGGFGQGGGIYCHASTPTIIDCIIVDNSVTGSGGGISSWSSNPTLVSTVVCGNSPDQIDGTWTDGGGNLVNAFCPLLGACCNGEICETVTQADCEATGGDYQGDEIPCSDLTCFVPIYGACCTNDICVISEEDSCATYGGAWLGDGTTCDDSPCPSACLGDTDGDGDVNVNDILLVIARFGVTCP